MVISRMKTEDVTDAARIEEKIFSTPWSEQSFLEALEQEYTIFFAAKKKEHCVGYIGAYFVADEGASFIFLRNSVGNIPNCF